MNRGYWIQEVGWLGLKGWGLEGLWPALLMYEWDHEFIYDNQFRQKPGLGMLGLLEIIKPMAPHICGLDPGRIWGSLAKSWTYGHQNPEWSGDKGVKGNQVWGDYAVAVTPWQSWESKPMGCIHVKLSTLRQALNSGYWSWGKGLEPLLVSSNLVKLCYDAWVANTNHVFVLRVSICLWTSEQIGSRIRHLSILGLIPSASTQCYISSSCEMVTMVHVATQT